MTAIRFRSDPHAIWDLLAGYHGTLAFDVGANGGPVSRLLAPNFGRIVAFEPCAESFDELAVSVPENVTVSPLALSSKHGPITLVEAAEAQKVGELVTGDSLAYSWGDKTGERTVKATTLDEAATCYGTPDFVKIDTEGHEVEVVAGGLAILDADGPRLFIEVHAEANGPRIATLLPAYRFEVIRHDGYAPDHPGWANHYYMIGETA